MEGVHGRGRPKVLEQHRDEAELVGDARCLQESAGWRRGDPDNPRVSLPPHGTPISWVPPCTDSSRTPATPLPGQGGGPQGGFGGADHYRDHREPVSESRQLTFGNNVQAQAFVPATNDPEYATAEEAEAAFVKLLRRSGVQPEWSWEQTIRATVKDPQFRAIKDPRDRKAAFEKYCNDVVVQDKERAKERLTKLRADFATMLRSHPEIKHYTRWKTARPMIEGETIFRSTNNENERRQLFEDYIVDLKKAHKEQQVALRKSAMDGLIELLPTLNLEPYTRWSDAQGTIQSTAPFQKDEKYKSLTKYDVLTVFQNHVKALERKFNDSVQEEKNKKLRRERRARDSFTALLSELRKDGKIKAGTKWSQIRPLIEADERYQAVAGQNGSTAMDLFWDVVEEEERVLRSIRNDVLDVIDVCQPLRRLLHDASNARFLGQTLRGHPQGYVPRVRVSSQR